MMAQPSPDVRRVAEQAQTKVAVAVRADPICTLAQQALSELAAALAARDGAMIATALVTVKEAEAILRATYGDSSPEISKLIAACADSVRQWEEPFRSEPQDQALLTRIHGELEKFGKERDRAGDSVAAPREEKASTDIEAPSEARDRPAIVSPYNTITCLACSAWNFPSSARCLRCNARLRRPRESDRLQTARRNSHWIAPGVFVLVALAAWAVVPRVISTKQLEPPATERSFGSAIVSASATLVDADGKLVKTLEAGTSLDLLELARRNPAARVRVQVKEQGSKVEGYVALSQLGRVETTDPELDLWHAEETFPNPDTTNPSELKERVAFLDRLTLQYRGQVRSSLLMKLANAHISLYRAVRPDSIEGNEDRAKALAYLTRVKADGTFAPAADAAIKTREGMEAPRENEAPTIAIPAAASPQKLSTIKNLLAQKTRPAEFDRIIEDIDRLRQRHPTDKDLLSLRKKAAFLREEASK